MWIRVIATIWFLMILVFVGALGLKIANGSIFDTNIITLLPSTESARELKKPIAKVNDLFERKLVFMFDLPTDKNVKQIHDQLHRELIKMQSEGDLRIVEYKDTVFNTINFYQNLRFSFLSDETQNLLQTNQRKVFEQKVIQSYFNSSRFISSQMVKEDPLGLHASLLESKFSPPVESYIKDGLLISQHKNRYYIFLFAELNASPFALTTQNSVMLKFQRISREIKKNYNDTHFHIIGALPHAYWGTNNARNEIFFFGSISIIGIILLFIVFFKSLKPLFLTFTTIIIGCIAGCAACFIIFGNIHLLTLVFGTSLVGIGVDYSFHYFCTGFDKSHKWQSQKSLTDVFPAITLGLITTLIAFLGLAYSPFPGIKQMAVFSIAGLASVYLFVCIGYPRLAERANFPNMSFVLNIGQAYIKFWDNLKPAIKVLVIFTLLAVSLIGIARLSIKDDVQLLQAPNPELLQVEMLARDVGQQRIASQFFLVEGRDSEDLLIKQERLTVSLKKLEKDNFLEGHRALSDFIPSIAKQKRTRALLAPVVNNENGSFGRIASQVGLPSKTVSDYRLAFAESQDRLVSLSDWLQHPASMPYRYLWLGKFERGVIGIVQLNEIRNLNTLSRLGQEQDGVYFIDQVSGYTNFFRKYRSQIINITIISYILIWLLLTIRYGMFNGLVMMLPPVLSACVAVGLIGLIGYPFTLFHMMALLLVLGIGVDYSIFFREASRNSVTTFLAILLSALTTILAFGLLAFSQTFAIHAFGIMSFLGIILALILSPIARWGRADER